MFFMPEFFAEANWREDFTTSKYWVLGLLESNCELNEEFKSRIQYLLTLSKNEGSIQSDKIYQTIK